MLRLDLVLSWLGYPSVHQLWCISDFMRGMIPCTSAGVFFWLWSYAMWVLSVSRQFLIAQCSCSKGWRSHHGRCRGPGILRVSAEFLLYTLSFQGVLIDECSRHTVVPNNFRIAATARQITPQHHNTTWLTRLMPTGLRQRTIVRWSGYTSTLWLFLFSPGREDFNVRLTGRLAWLQRLRYGMINFRHLHIYKHIYTPFLVAYALNRMQINQIFGFQRFASLGVGDRLPPS